MDDEQAVHRLFAWATETGKIKLVVKHFDELLHQVIEPFAAANAQDSAAQVLSREASILSCELHKQQKAAGRRVAPLPQRGLGLRVRKALKAGKDRSRTSASRLAPVRRNLRTRVFHNTAQEPASPSNDEAPVSRRGALISPEDETKEDGNQEAYDGDDGRDEVAEDDDELSYMTASEGEGDEDEDEDEQGKEDQVVFASRAESMPQVVRTPSRVLQWAARRQTGYEGNLTADQAADLAELRDLMLAGEYAEDVKRWRDGPDRLLLRFLRAECSKKRKFNVAKSLRRLERTLQWRRDNKIDSFLEAPPPEWKRYREVLSEAEVFDNEGRLLVITRGAVLAKYLEIDEFTTEQWEMCTAMNVEYRMSLLRAESTRRGYEVSTQVLLFDLRGGLSLSARNMIPLIRAANAISSAHYPEMVDSVYICTAPKVFSFLANLVQGFLDPVLREKIRVFPVGKAGNAQFLEHLHDQVALEDLPREYGGTGNVELGMPLHALRKGCKTPPPFDL